MKNITHLVFDLGGVIVELNGKPIKPEWFAESEVPDDIWQQWLLSAAPREYESGRISESEFATRVVRELSLNTSVSSFLRHFTALPVGPYAGARELLLKLKKRYKTALFSNSNPVHWARKMGEMQLGELFDYYYASHLMGCAKPEQQAYLKVLDGLSVPATQVLFFDDNQLNVDAARETGMHAETVVGFDQLVEKLKELNILDNRES